MTETQAIWDPLQYAVELPLKAVLYPVGFPLEVETNSPEVLEALAESYGGFESRFSRPPIQLRVAVTGYESASLPPVPSYLGLGYLLSVVSDARNFGVVDYTRRFAFCRLDSSVVCERMWMSYHFLEGMVYSALEQLYATAIHAGLVGRHGRAILLCGGSCAGKTTLSYACARKGWTFLADNCTWLVKGDQSRRVLGNPLQISFRESAAAVFPELAGRPTADLINGKRSIVLRTAEAPAIATAFESCAAGIVFLNRDGSNPARLEPVSCREAIRRIRAFQPRYDSPVVEEQIASVQRLLEVDAFDLHYREMDDAIEQLEKLV